MPTLPIPMFSALVLAFLLIRSLIRRDVSEPLMYLIGLCAVQSALIAAVQHYGLTILRPVQPVTASLIPPLAWLAFVLTSQRSFEPRRDLPHLTIPLVFFLVVLLVPRSLDIAIPLLFASYGIALFKRLSNGRDSLIKTRLDSGENPLTLWRIIAASLVLSACADLLILVDQVAWQGHYTSLIISFISSISLLTLGLISPSRDLGDADTGDAPDPDPQDIQRDGELMSRLETLLEKDRLYLDPDLTLGQLARKLTVPVKQLSSAINRSKGENVSRYINGFRIAHACTLLQEGANITHAMYESGFNTKSNFNREFLRIKGCSPRDWKEKTRAQ